MHEKFWFLFLNQKESFLADHPISELTLYEIKLLELISIAHENCTPLSVGQALSLKLIGSPARVHKMLRRLLDKNFICHVHADRNFRKKFLQPCALAYEYFDLMGKLLIRANANTGLTPSSAQ